MSCFLRVFETKFKNNYHEWKCQRIVFLIIIVSNDSFRHFALVFWNSMWQSNYNRCIINKYNIMVYHLNLCQNETSRQLVTRSHDIIRVFGVGWKHCSDLNLSLRQWFRDHIRFLHHCKRFPRLQANDSFIHKIYVMPIGKGPVGRTPKK